MKSREDSLSELSELIFHQKAPKHFGNDITQCEVLLKPRIESNLAKIIENSLKQLAVSFRSITEDKGTTSQNELKVGFAFEEFLEISTAIANKDKQQFEDCVSQLSINYLVSYHTCDISSLFVLSYSLALRAKKLHDENQFDQAWPTIAEAKLYEGKIQGLIEGEQFLSQHLARSEKNAQGGLATAKYYAPAKDEAKRLLVDCAPPIGWENKEVAINTIEEPFSKYIAQNHITISDVHDLLRKWLTHSEFNVIYNANSKRSKKKKLAT
jgi:hypothetical protein